MSDTKKPTLSLEEQLKKCPRGRDGNKELEEQGISSLIIPAHERLSPKEIKARIKSFKKEV